MVSSIVSYTYTDKTNQLKTIAVKNSLGENTLDITYGTPLGGGMPDVVKSESRNGSMSRAYFYDSLGRLYKERSLISSGSIEREFAYKNLSGNRTTSQVYQLTTNGVTYTYTYDNRGNIQTVSDGSGVTRYTYDNLDQLIREDNAELNKTFVYTYTNGNITRREEYAYTTGTVGTAIKTDTWTYGNSSWGDVLTEYNDVSTEVSNGRITSLGGKALTYSYLGLLATAGTTSYDYDTTGRRLKKTTGSTVTNYYYAGDMLVGEKTGSNKLEFMYDSAGVYYGFEYNDTPYFYVKNLQGDVIAIVNNAGTTVATYEYDAWGRILSTTDTSGNNIGTINPIRYRGYYYDKETGFYYLKTRYYAPEICRFISADIYVSTGQDILGTNMFAYCYNNPVRYSDNQGYRPIDSLSVQSETKEQRKRSFEQMNPNKKITINYNDYYGSTYSFGLTYGYSSGGVSLNKSRVLSMDGENNAFQKTISDGTSIGFGASFGITATITNAKSVDDLTGTSYSCGATVVALGGLTIDYVTFRSSKNNDILYDGITMSLCFGAEAEIHYFENKTEHIKYYTSPLEHFLYKVFS